MSVDIANTFLNTTTTVTTGGRAAAQSPGALLSVILPNVIVAAAVIFFVQIIYGGYKLVSSAGGNHSPQDMAKAQGYVTWGLVGFIVVVSSFFIVQILSNIIFGDNSLLNIRTF